MHHEVPDTCKETVLKHSPNNMELFLKTGNRYERLDLRRLLYIKAAGKYIELYFEHDGKKLIRISLVNFLKERFKIDVVRIHKSYAVNAAYVTAYSSREVILSGQKIPVGRNYKKNLAECMAHNTHKLKKQQLSASGDTKEA